jgi:Zn-dependent protease with chaperone function
MYMKDKRFKVHKKENLYFIISLLVSISCYFFLTKGIAYLKAQNVIFLIYLGIIGIFLIFSHVILIGHLKGNAVEITQKQFPDIFEIIKRQSSELGLSKVPTMYLVQNAGILNAFATKFFYRNYIVLYSSLIETAYTEGTDVVEFVVGHELGHIYRKHVGLFRSILLFPSRLIPFLFSAYSRAREYTCDNIGHALSPKGAEKGLLILASGKVLYKKVDVSEYIRNANRASGFISWFAEIFSTHPHITKRLKNIIKS